MKTSIKILLGLLLVIFMIPTVLIMAYSYQVKKAGFKPYNEADHWSRVDLGPSRFIKITAPDKVALDCTLRFSDKPHYMVWDYGHGGGDSVSISQQADTLFVTYIQSNLNEQSQDGRSLELFVSDWQQLQVDGAMVNIDSSFGSADKNIVLANSQLELGVSRVDDENEKEENAAQMLAHDSISRGMNNLILNASHSGLVVNSGFSIKNLQLAFQDGSVNIWSGAQVERVSGTLSPATRLQVDGAFVSNFKALAVK